MRLWDVRSGQIRHILQGHTDSISSIAFSPDGSLLASAGSDQSVRVWELAIVGGFKTDARPLGPRLRARHLLQGHRHQIYALAFRPHMEGAQQILASGSADETIILWDARTGERLKTLSIPGPYEGMNITGVTGISEAQKATLKALGAVEDDGMK